MDSLTPARGRLSRAERKAQTRKRLLDAAVRVFAGKGYQGASVDEVAAEAGFTVGALYSHFAGKQGLFLAVFERHCDEELARIQAIMAAGGTIEDQLEAIGRQSANLDEADRRWWLLSTELWLYAQRDPGVRDRLVALDRKVRGVIAHALRNHAARTGQPLPAPAAELATALHGLWQGLMHHRLLDPDAVPPESIGVALTWLLRGSGGSLVSQYPDGH